MENLFVNVTYSRSTQTYIYIYISCQDKFNYKVIIKYKIFLPHMHIHASQIFLHNSDIFIKVISMNQKANRSASFFGEVSS
jgi:hypothetical protein